MRAFHSLPTTDQDKTQIRACARVWAILNSLWVHLPSMHCINLALAALRLKVRYRRLELYLTVKGTPPYQTHPILLLKSHTPEERAWTR